jgi:hypothetical protein
VHVGIFLLGVLYRYNISAYMFCQYGIFVFDFIDIVIGKISNSCGCDVLSYPFLLEFSKAFLLK